MNIKIYQKIKGVKKKILITKNSFKEAFQFSYDKKDQYKKMFKISLMTVGLSLATMQFGPYLNNLMMKELIKKQTIENLSTFKEKAGIDTYTDMNKVLDVIKENENIPDYLKQKLEKYLSFYWWDSEHTDFSVFVYNIQNIKKVEVVNKETMQTIAHNSPNAYATLSASGTLYLSDQIKQDKQFYELFTGLFYNTSVSTPLNRYIYQEQYQLHDLHIGDLDTFKKEVGIEDANIDKALKAIDENQNISSSHKEKIRNYLISFHNAHEDFDLSIFTYNMKTLKEIGYKDLEEIQKNAGKNTCAYFSSYKHVIYIAEEEKENEDTFLHEVTHMFDNASCIKDGLVYVYKPYFKGGKYLMEGWTSATSNDVISYKVGQMYAKLFSNMTESFDSFVEKGNYEGLVEELASLKGTKEEAKAYLSLIEKKEAQYMDVYSIIQSDYAVASLLDDSSLDFSQKQNKVEMEYPQNLIVSDENQNILQKVEMDETLSLFDQTLDYCFAKTQKEAQKGKKNFEDSYYLTLTQLEDFFYQFIDAFKQVEYTNIQEPFLEKTFAFEENMMQFYKENYNPDIHLCEIPSYSGLNLLYPYEEMALYSWYISNQEGGSIQGIEVTWDSMYSRLEYKKSTELNTFQFVEKKAKVSDYVSLGEMPISDHSYSIFNSNQYYSILNKEYTSKFK